MKKHRAFVSLVIGVVVLAGCALDTADAQEEMTTDDGAEIVSAGSCSTATAKTTATVKILTINLRNNSDDWKRRFPLIADEIVLLNPDLIGLQEIEIGDDAADHLNDLIAARGHAKYNLYQERKPGFFGFFTGEGVGIMSRWPIVEKHHEDLPEMRVSVLARVKHPSGGFIDMTNTHLHHKGGAEAETIRVEEAKQTIDLVNRSSACYPTFLTGDMNARDTNPSVKSFVTAGFVDSYKAIHGAATAPGGYTIPIKLADGAFTQSPTARIDFVFGRSAGARTVKPLDSVVAFKNHDAKGFWPSDHLGVMTTYEVKM